MVFELRIGTPRHVHRSLFADALQTGAKPFDLNVAALVDPADLHADWTASTTSW